MYNKNNEKGKILRVGSFNKWSKFGRIPLRNVVVISRKIDIHIFLMDNNVSLLKYNSTNFLSNTQFLRLGSIKTALWRA